MTMKCLVLLLCLIGSVTESLILQRIHVPRITRSGEDVVLKCEFDLHGEGLYAVKWYKDIYEFFRYVPADTPSIRTHSIRGINVDIEHSNANRVVLKSVNVSSTGLYRVEVSAEAPFFETGYREDHMTVVYLPQEDPKITGSLQSAHNIGDILNLNCTTPKSYPLANISWFINNIKVSNSHGQSDNFLGSNNGNEFPYQEPIIASNTLPLYVKLDEDHFSADGQAKIKCVATIHAMFDQPTDTDGNVVHHVVNTAGLESVDAEMRMRHSSRNFHRNNRNSFPNAILYKGQTEITVKGAASKPTSWSLVIQLMIESFMSICVNNLLFAN